MSVTPYAVEPPNIYDFVHLDLAGLFGVACAELRMGGCVGGVWQYHIDVHNHPSCKPNAPHIVVSFGISSAEACAEPQRVIALMKSRMFEALSDAFRLIAENYQPSHEVYDAAEAAEQNT